VVLIVIENHHGVYGKPMPKTYGTPTTLRIWISMGNENLEEAREHVEDAI